MDNEKIGKFILSARKKKNLKQSELAKILHVTDKTVSRWETGRGTPGLDLLIPLSEALDVSLNELLNGEWIDNNKIKEASEKALLKTINYSNLKLKKSKIFFNLLFLILLLFILTADLLNTFGLFLLVIGLLGFLSWQILLKNKKKFLIIFIGTLLFFGYSYGTYEGNARLSLFLMGYPKDAYTTKFREFKREGKVFYYPLNDLQVASGRFGLIKCEEKLGLKFCSYYGYG